MHYLFPWEKTIQDYSREYSKIQSSGAFETKEATKIAVLGSHTLNYFSKILAVRLFENGIPANIWTAPYGQIEGQGINPQSELNRFKPEFVLIIQDLNDALGEHVETIEFSSKESKAGFIDTTIAYCKRLMNSFKNKGYKLLLSNFLVPATTVYGAMEPKQKGARRFVQELNHRLHDEFIKDTNVTVIDLDSACGNAGKIDSENEKFKFLGDVHLSFKQSIMLAEEVLGAIIAIKGRTKKCIVLDLDNTVWGGIIGEDGLSGIKLGQNDPVGKAYQAFQKEVLKLHNRGIILAINSKNNEEDALDVLRNHPEMALREEHFAAIRANWQDKAKNLDEIASELNIGLDSIVFIDDDEFNIELVKQSFPQVTTILLPRDPAAYPLLIKTLRLFDSQNLTEEDLTRGKMYADDKKRKDSSKSFQTYEDFLESLDLTIQVKKADAFTMPRISQLSIRTNQFNMTTKRYSEGDILKFTASPDYDVHWMSVKDRFGDYGVIGACIVVKHKKHAEIDSFYMSCRVLGKGIENSFIWKVLQGLKQQNYERVTATTIPTKKNQAFLDFYLKAGFKQTGDNQYQYDLKDAAITFPKHIKWE